MHDYGMQKDDIFAKIAVLDLHELRFSIQSLEYLCQQPEACSMYS